MDYGTIFNENIDIIASLILVCDFQILLTLNKINNYYRKVLSEKHILIFLSNKFSTKFMYTFADFVKEYKQYKSHVFFILNKLSSIYHVYLGFNRKNIASGNVSHDEHFSIIDENENVDVILDGYYNEFFNKILLIAIKDGDKIYRNDDCITDATQLHANDYVIIEYDRDKLIKEASLLIPFRIVILKYKYSWTEINIEWYNLSFESNVETDFLPRISSRPWIKIDIPFEQITISKDIKGHDLTIDDILFTTLALASNCLQSINHGSGYEIIREHDDVVIMRPDIMEYVD